MQLSAHLAFAHRLARAAEAEILPRFQQTLTEYKTDGSAVTEADRAAERAMRVLLEAEHPADGILGEEFAVVEGTSRYRWVLDPIDGTTWFALGIAKFGTLVGLLDGRQPVLGLVHLPVTAETLYAERGAGCWYRRGGAAPERVAVDARVSTLSSAFVSSGSLRESEIVRSTSAARFRQGEVLRRARRFEFVGDCVQHMLVARGRLHAALDPVMKPWDIAALIPCLQEAGAVVTTMDGEADDLVFDDSLLSSCHPALHDELLSLLQSTPSTNATS